MVWQGRQSQRQQSQKQWQLHTQQSTAAPAQWAAPQAEEAAESAGSGSDVFACEGPDSQEVVVKKLAGEYVEHGQWASKKSPTTSPSSLAGAKAAAPAAALIAGRGWETKTFRTRIAMKILFGPSPTEAIVGEVAAGEKMKLVLHAYHQSEDGVAFVPVQRSPSFGWATLGACRADGSGTKYIFMRPLDTANWFAGFAGVGRGHVGSEWEVLTECSISASDDLFSGVLCKLQPGAVVVQTGDPVTIDGLIRLPIKPKEYVLPIISGWRAASTLICSDIEEQSGCNEQAPKSQQWPSESWQAAPPTHAAPIGQHVAPIVQEAPNELRNVHVQDCMSKERNTPPPPPGPHPSTKQYQEAAQLQFAPPPDRHLDGDMQLQLYGEQLYVLVQPMVADQYITQKIIGMLLELPQNELVMNLTNHSELSKRVEEAVELLRSDGVV